MHADLLLHVVDAASPVRLEQIEQVNKVLEEIGAHQIPQILVWNKIDVDDLQPAIERDEYDKIQRVFISAKSGIGLDLLREAIIEQAQVRNLARQTKLEYELSRLVEEQCFEFNAIPNSPFPSLTHVGLK